MRPTKALLNAATTQDLITRLSRVRVCALSQNAGHIKIINYMTYKRRVSVTHTGRQNVGCMVYISVSKCTCYR